jgi:hypothetical protein
MSEKLKDQDAHVHTRFTQVWEAIAELQAKQMADHEIMNCFATMLPKRAIEMNSKYVALVKKHRKKLLPAPDKKWD